MRSRVKIPFKFTYIAKLLVLAIPVSVIMELLKPMTYVGCLPPTESYQWQLIFVRSFQTANGTNGNQWQPMVPMIKLPMVPLVKLRTHGILAVSVIRWTSKICKSRIQQIEIFRKLYNISTVLTMIVHKSNINKATKQEKSTFIIRKNCRKATLRFGIKSTYVFIDI